MSSLVLKMFVSGYGVISTLYFLVAFFLQLSGENTSWLLNYLFYFLMINAIVLTLISVGNKKGFCYWLPLSQERKVILGFKIVVSLFFVFFIANIAYWLYQIKYVVPSGDIELREFYLMLMFYSFMSFVSILIPTSFVVELKTVLPEKVIKITGG